MTLTASTDLHRNNWRDVIELTLILDLHNDSNNPSPDIEAIYLFSSDQWSFKQDGHDVPSSDTETAPNTRRHFLKPPVRRLVKNGWAQITAMGKKTIWLEDGQEHPGSYPIKGRVPVSLATSAGTFDQTFTLDKIAEKSRS